MASRLYLKNHKWKTYSRFTQELKRKKYKHNTKGNNQTTKEKTKRKEQRNTKSVGKIKIKMVMNTYLSMITLNVNELNAPSKRHRMAVDLKQNKTNKELKPTRDSL